MEAVNHEAARIRAALKTAGVPVAELSVYHGKGSGIRLRLQGEEVTDISVLSGSKITMLTLRETAVTNLAPLKSCQIRSLSLHGSNISDISALEGSTFYLLDLTETAVTDLAPVARITILDELRLRGTRVSDITPLQKSTIRSLDIRDTAVTNLAPIVKMQKLEKLDLTTPQLMQNLDVLRRVKIFVWEGGTNSFSTQGLAWEHRFGRYKEFFQTGPNKSVEPPRALPGASGSP